MSTHDADKTGDTPAERRTMTRDPNATSGPIVETGETDKDGNHITAAGSVACTTNIDGKWRVCNSRGEPFTKTEYETESDAVEAAQKKNAPHLAALAAKNGQ